MGDLWMHQLTYRAEYSEVFDKKTGWLPCPTLSIHPISPGVRFFFTSLDEKKVLKGKRFTDVEEGRQKMAEALKGIEIDQFKTFFEQWKNVLIGVLHQVESTLKVTKV